MNGNLRCQRKGLAGEEYLYGTNEKLWAGMLVTSIRSAERRSLGCDATHMLKA
jgi:hypothetical protein